MKLRVGRLKAWPNTRPCPLAQGRITFPCLHAFCEAPPTCTFNATDRLATDRHHQGLNADDKDTTSSMGRDSHNEPFLISETTAQCDRYKRLNLLFQVAWSRRLAASINSGNGHGAMTPLRPHAARFERFIRIRTSALAGPSAPSQPQPTL